MKRRNGLQTATTRHHTVARLIDSSKTLPKKKQGYEDIYGRLGRDVNQLARKANPPRKKGKKRFGF